MQVPERWLRSFVDPDLSSDELGELLTMSGLEVDDVRHRAPPFNRVVVARIVEATPHPDADRLRICMVDVGDSTVQIVCGAPNAAAGLLVPCALPGAILPGGLEIKQASLRGVDSFGMLCSAKELGISDDSAGLMVLASDAVPGTCLREWLQLDEPLFLLKMTPNRPDCLSLLGVAREVSALTGCNLASVLVDDRPVSTDDRVDVNVMNLEACPLYLGRVIELEKTNPQTPSWMRERLIRCGLRPVSAVVDITNYVMLELGQPLHAFDRHKINGAVSVRMSQQGESLALLNGTQVVLGDDVLLICDDKGPLAMAGIMGGENSAVDENTHGVFLEAAFFDPKAIAGRARRHGLVTDAAHRFERGVDFGLTRVAMDRAVDLILQICGGRVGPLVQSTGVLPERQPVVARISRINSLMGVELSVNDMKAYLQRLGCEVQPLESDKLQITPPSYRFDLTIEEDIVEEVARLYGYQNIPTTPPQASLVMSESPEGKRTVARIKDFLVSLGYQEVINYSFVDKEWEKTLLGNPNPIRLANPIASQMSVMRTSLIGGLLANLMTNLKRNQTTVRLFEIGRVFFTTSCTTEDVSGYSQPQKIAALLYGTSNPEQWGESSRNIDFYDAKGDLERLLSRRDITFKPLKDHPAFHPGRCASVQARGHTVGVIGELHPLHMAGFELPGAPVLYEIDLSILEECQVPTFEPISNQPIVTRDLAILVPESVPVHEIIQAFREGASSFVVDIQLFDLYRGKGVSEGEKSLAFRIVMQDTQRTLVENEVDSQMKIFIDIVSKKFSGQLRD